MGTIVLMGLMALTPAYGDVITISPSNPTSLDDVQIWVARWTPTGGWSLRGEQAPVVDNVIQLDLYWSEPGPGPGTQVTMAFERHTYTADVGKLAPGTYTVNVIDHGRNNGTQSTSFTVRPPCNCICHKYPEMFAGRICLFCGCGGRSTPSNTGGSLLELSTPSNRGGSLLDWLLSWMAALRQR